MFITFRCYLIAHCLCKQNIELKWVNELVLKLSDFLLIIKIHPGSTTLKISLILFSPSPVLKGKSATQLAIFLEILRFFHWRPYATRCYLLKSTIFALESSTLTGTSDERKPLHEEIYRSYSESYATDQKTVWERKRRAYRKAFGCIWGTKKSKFGSWTKSSRGACNNISSTLHGHRYTLKVRLFREDWTFLQVYGWIGSLSTRPQYFHIMDYEDAIISPNNELHSGVFNMLE